MTNLTLLNQINEWLKILYAGKNIGTEAIFNLAILVSGILVGPHVQLFSIAMCIPLPIKLQSIIRRLERFVSDERIEVRKFFEPFVLAMISCLGNETAYLIIDCTKAGKKCRTLFVGIAYHGTVIPLIWKTVKGGKGHVKAELQKNLLYALRNQLRHCSRVVVLGDAEFSNGLVIEGLNSISWDYVFSFQESYLVQLEEGGHWLSAQEIAKEAGMKPGEVRHWSNVCFTQSNKIAGQTLTIDWGEGEEEPLYLISALSPEESPHLIYKMRFWVETLFGNFKSRGFQLSRTQMVTPEHIDRLVLGIAIATCIALGVGTHLIVTEQSDLVDRSDRRDLSLFQIGWRGIYRFLALNCLEKIEKIQLRFDWTMELPPAGFQPA